jgi:hypothetical protein
MRTAGLLIAFAGLLALASGAACSSGSTPVAASSDDGGGTGNELNPDGVPYPDAPSGGYGHTARSGSTPGSVIQNFKFQGYVNGDDSTPQMTTISLADYYDPCNKRLKILHLSVAAVWCVPCGDETDAVVADLASSSSTLNTNKVVFLQALDEGPTAGVPATQSDLQFWIMKHSSNFTEMLDPELANLSGFFPAAEVPWNCDIDPRTMEILDSSEGWNGSVSDELQPALAALPATPSYPIPPSAACN